MVQEDLVRSSLVGIVALLPQACNFVFFASRITAPIAQIARKRCQSSGKTILFLTGPGISIYLHMLFFRSHVCDCYCCSPLAAEHSGPRSPSPRARGGCGLSHLRFKTLLSILGRKIACPCKSRLPLVPSYHRFPLLGITFISRIGSSTTTSSPRREAKTFVVCSQFEIICNRFLTQTSLQHCLLSICPICPSIS